MDCPTCNAIVDGDAIACWNCGNSLRVQTEEAPPQPAPTAPPAANRDAFRDPTRLTTWLQVLLIASVAIYPVFLVDFFFEYELIRDIEMGAFFSKEDLNKGIDEHETLSFISFRVYPLNARMNTLYDCFNAGGSHDREIHSPRLLQTLS